MSWLSEAWNWLTKKKPAPTDIAANRVVTKRLEVVGEGGGIEFSSGKNGVRIVLANPDKFKNMFSIFLKTNGEINMDFIGPDGFVEAAIDMAPDGTIFPSIPDKDDEDPTPPSS